MSETKVEVPEDLMERAREILYPKEPMNAPVLEFRIAAALRSMIDDSLTNRIKQLSDQVEVLRDELAKSNLTVMTQRTCIRSVRAFINQMKAAVDLPPMEG